MQGLSHCRHNERCVTIRQLYINHVYKFSLDKSQFILFPIISTYRNVSLLFYKTKCQLNHTAEK